MDAGLRLPPTALKRSQWTSCQSLCGSYRYRSTVLMFAELMSPVCVWGLHQLQKIQIWLKKKKKLFLMCLTWHISLGPYWWPRPWLHFLEALHLSIFICSLRYRKHSWCHELCETGERKKKKEFTWLHNTKSLGSFYDPSADRRAVITPGGMERQV